MQILAQSQPPAKVSYIHLAYLSAQLSNRITKGEIASVQTMLGMAVAAAIGCGIVGARRAPHGKRERALKIWGGLAFVGVFCVLWLVQTVWSETRSNEQAVQHVIQTRQWWALRDNAIADGIIAAARTNAEAASLATWYYGTTYRGGNGPPETVVKALRAGEFAAALGHPSHWVNLEDLTNSSNAEHLSGVFKLALEQGKLSQEEQNWAKGKISQMTTNLAYQP